MFRYRFPVLASLKLLVAFAAPVWAQHQHEGDIIIGRSSGGVLKIEADLDECRLVQPVSGLLNGWAGDEPGFEAIMEDEPGEDLFRLDAGAQIWLEALSLDPAFKVRNPLNPLQVIDAPGERLLLGRHDLHDHVIWHVDSADVGHNPLETEWHGTFRLLDLGTTAYGASEPFTVCVTNVPEPVSLAMLAPGVVILAARRVGRRMPRAGRRST